MATEKTVLKNGQTFQFKNIVLHGALENWNDTQGVRIANHKYLKRNGGECEPMGSDQAMYSFKCVFIDGVTSRYEQVRAAILADPLGLLIHPRLGKIQVACSMLQAKEDPANGVNVLDFTISFIENSADIKKEEFTISPQTSISVTQGFISQLNTVVGGVSIVGTISVLSSVARFAVRDVVAKFISITNTFLQFANEAAASIYQVPALVSQLTQVIKAGDATIAYIKGLGKSDAVMWPLIDAVKEIQASSINTYNAILANKPPIITFTVPSTMSVRTIAARIYGKDARNRLPEILLLNTILNPAAVPVGTVLKISSPLQIGT